MKENKEYPIHWEAHTESCSVCTKPTGNCGRPKKPLKSQYKLLSHTKRVSLQMPLNIIHSNITVFSAVSNGLLSLLQLRPSGGLLNSCSSAESSVGSSGSLSPLLSPPHPVLHQPADSPLTPLEQELLATLPNFLKMSLKFSEYHRKRNCISENILKS